MGTIIKKRPSFFLSAKRRVLINNAIVSLFILLFIYTATSKIYAFRDFDNILHFVPVFGSFHLTIAVLIISSQIIIGALLIIPSTKDRGLYATLVLMFIFTIYLIYMVFFENVRPCSCGGISAQLSWENHIWLNMILTGLAFLGLLTNQNKKQQL